MSIFWASSVSTDILPRSAPERSRTRRTSSIAVEIAEPEVVGSDALTITITSAVWPECSIRA